MPTENNSAAEAAKTADAPAKSGGGGSFIGGLALLLALGAAGGAAYLWWTQQQQQGSAGQQTARLDTALAEATDRIGRLEEQLAQNATAAEGRSTALSKQLERQSGELENLPPRLARLERALEELPGISDKARTAWLISEAEYYLRIANAQVQLARNPEVALRAQELADEKLRDTAEPRLTPVRALLADEMTALRAVPRPDTEGMVLAISSLSRSLEDLPLAQQAPLRFEQEVAADDEATGLTRAWNRLKDALLGLIRIKRSDEDITPLRTSAEESLLLRRLEAELELARVALLNGNGKLYRNLLDDVKTARRRHFDNDAPAVRAAINKLADLSREELPETGLPDVSGSLDLLLRVSGEAGTT